MVISTWSVSFSFIVCKYFSKWQLLKIVFRHVKTCLKPEKDWIHPLPSNFDGLPYPQVKMTTKGVNEIIYNMS